MTTPNAFFIKPKLSAWRAILLYAAYQPDAPDFDAILYVPEKFALGSFKETRDGFVLIPDRILYYSGQAFRQYKQDIANKDFEFVQELKLPGEFLDDIASKADNCSEAKKLFSNLTLSLSELTSSIDLKLEYVEGLK